MADRYHPQYHAGQCKAAPDRWRVRQRLCNHSAFNGYHETPSAYSGLVCLECQATWRTKASYVSTIVDVKPGEWP